MSNQKFNFVLHKGDWNIKLITSDGCGFVMIGWDELDDCAWLSCLSVCEEKRRKGYGNALINKAQEIIKELGKNNILLEADSKSWVVGWYERLGFVKCNDSNDKYTLMNKRI